MKKIALLMAALTFLACGCKSHKSAVVNVAPQFQPDEVWVLTAIRDKAVTYAEGQRICTIVINPEAGTFNGCSGCNRYFGNFKDLGKGKIELSDYNGTKMACPENFMALERSYMQQLHKVDGYELGAYTLELKQGDKVVLTFAKQEEDKK